MELRRRAGLPAWRTRTVQGKSLPDGETAPRPEKVTGLEATVLPAARCYEARSAPLFSSPSEAAVGACLPAAPNRGCAANARVTS